jgi:hypothetical protein
MSRDTGIGIGLLALCALLYWQAGLASAPPFVPIGPSFYPRVILLLTAGLAVWLIAEELFKKRAPAGQVKKAAGSPSNYRRVVLGFIVFFGYVACLTLIGYVVATFLFVLGLSWAIGPRDVREIPKLMAVAIGTAVATYLVFEKYLYVFLPRGMLF